MSSLVLVLASIGVIQALFLCAYLFSLRAGNRQAQLFLALILLGLSIRIGKSVFNHFWELDPWMRNIGLAGFLMVGPSLWLYARALIDGRAERSSVLLSHYGLALSYLLFCWLIPNERNWASYLSYSIVLLHFLAYLVMTEIARRGAGQRASLAPEPSQWLRNIIIGLALVWIYYLLVFVRVLPFYIGGAIFYSCLIYMLSYLILQKQRFAQEKYAGSRQSSRESKALLERVIQIMDSDALYLNPKLKLNDVARRVSVEPRELSRAVNEHSSKNFSGMVNEYRVLKAREILSDPAKRELKLAAVAVESGFGNVTSFNVTFKEIVGVTPSEFREGNL